MADTTPQASANATMLCVESGPDIFYRIRVTGADERVVYVKVHDPDVIPEDDRTYGPSAVAALGKLIGGWSGSWVTMDVHHNDGKTRCERDTFAPPIVPADALRPNEHPSHDIFDLPVIREVSSRTFEVTNPNINGSPCFLKIARFPREAEWVRREIQAYYSLAGCALAPRFLGYVFETSSHRVIGFLVEKLEGRTAGPEDLARCSEALGELHSYLIHGDLCKYNIVVTAEGPKFIDFEVSTLVGTDGWTIEARDGESEALAAKLADTSELGKPWDHD